MSRCDRATYAHRYYTKHKAEIVQKAKDYRRRNVEKVRQQSAARYLRNRDTVRVQQRRYWMKKEYGMTQTQWDELFTKQGNRCAICFTSEISLRQRDWCVDHDHNTGAVRGILCNSCNLILGYSRDSIYVLQNAVMYLQKGKV